MKNTYTIPTPNNRNNAGCMGVSSAHLYEDGMLRSMNPNSGYKQFAVQTCQFVSLAILIAIFFNSNIKLFHQLYSPI